VIDRRKCLARLRIVNLRGKLIPQRGAIFRRSAARDPDDPHLPQLQAPGPGQSLAPQGRCRVEAMFCWLKAYRRIAFWL